MSSHERFEPISEHLDAPEQAPPIEEIEPLSPAHLTREPELTAAGQPTPSTSPDKPIAIGLVAARRLGMMRTGESEATFQKFIDNTNPENQSVLVPAVTDDAERHPSTKLDFQATDYLGALVSSLEHGQDKIWGHEHGSAAQLNIRIRREMLRQHEVDGR